ncbi:MAG: isocitrate lyase/PEP mutase family protein [Candidatus Bathyarchaeia archaeon]
MKKSSKFKRLLNSGEIVIAPGVYDAISAKIAEKAGFKVAYLTGFGTSISCIGQPDVGLMTMAEVVHHAGAIANAIDIPLFADADNGYGNAINVIRTVREFERQGVAGIHIEDQESPKRCGHMKGKLLVAEEEMVGKLKAAIDARENDDFVIIARTDAMGAVGGSFKQAIKRALLYAETGVDGLFAEFCEPNLKKIEEFSKVIRSHYPDIPLVFNYTTAFKWHKSPVSFADLGEMGYKLIILPLQLARVATMSMWDFIENLKSYGEKAIYELEKRIEGHITQDYHDFWGFPKIRELEEKYLPKGHFEMKYRHSLGFVKIQNNST